MEDVTGRAGSHSGSGSKEDVGGRPYKADRQRRNSGINANVNNSVGGAPVMHTVSRGGDDYHSGSKPPVEGESRCIGRCFIGGVSFVLMKVIVGRIVVVLAAMLLFVLLFMIVLLLLLLLVSLLLL